MFQVSQKTIILFALVLLLLAGLFFVFSGASKLQRYFNERKYQAQIEEFERPYREDTYGGATPEETYQLFIDALKQGNLKLASKYFVVKRQEEWLSNLKRIEEAGNLSSMILDLQRANPRGSLYENNFQFDVVDENNEVILLVNFTKNNFTNKWKIEDL